MRGRSRRGGAYVLVLGVTTMVGVMGVGAVLAQRVQFQARSFVEHSVAARIAAIAGLEMAMQQIDEDDQWRELLVADPSFPDVEVNGVTVAVTAASVGGGAIDPDDPAGPIELRAIAQIGSTRQSYRVVLEPIIGGIDPLSHSLVANGAIEFQEESQAHAERPIHAAEASASDADVYADVHVTEPVSGSSFRGAVVDDAAAPAVPELPAGFGDLLVSPVTIRASQLPVRDGVYRVTGVLGPGVNTVGGSASVSGHYIIDGESEEVAIEGLRLLGSLAASRISGPLVVSGSNNLTANGTSAPVLIVAGNVEFSMRPGPLDEQATGINYNPPGVPADDGTTDSDTNDTYPSLITGAIWVGGSGDASIRFPGLWLRGSLLARDAIVVDSHAVVRVQHLESLVTSPPEALGQQAGLRIDPTSWTRITQ